MKLTIADKSKSASTQWCIEISLESEKFRESYLVEDFSVPISSSSNQLLQQYFSDTIDNPDERAAVDAKIIKLGEDLADGILGEDHQLYKFTSLIEEQGYEQLDVTIISDKHDFHNIPWELLILPESPYILSAVTKSFQRSHNAPKDFPELCFELRYPQVPLKGLEGFTEGPAIDEGGVQPLHIFYCLLRPQNTQDIVEANFFKYIVSQHLNSKAFQFTLCQATNIKEIYRQIDASTKQYHVLHIDGLLSNVDNEMVFPLNTSNTQPEHHLQLSDIAKLSKDFNIPALILDIKHPQNIQNSTMVENNFADIGVKLLKYGVGNILMNNFVGTAQLQQAVLESFYQQIAKGINFGQAVVESRKQQQSTASESRLSQFGFPALSWPLFSHYAQQTLYYFQPQQNPEQADHTTTLNDKLFGFQNQYLPPMLHHSLDLNYGDIVSTLDNSVVQVYAEEGYGKTHMAHVLAQYMATHGLVDYCFYFDYHHAHYSAVDVRTMIAPVLNIDHEDNSTDDVDTTFMEELNKNKCLFIFDNIAPIDNNDSLQSIVSFAETITAAGHYVLLLSVADTQIAIHGINRIELRRPSNKEFNLIYQHELQLANPRSADVGLSESDHQLIALAQHNIWLLKKLIPTYITQENAQDYIDSMRDKLQNFGVNPSVKGFFECKLDQLPEGNKKLLILCSQAPNLILEMIAGVLGQADNMQAAKNLLTEFNLKETPYPTILECWCAEGLAVQFPHGKMLDKRLIRHLADEQHFVISEDIRADFDRVLCESLRILAGHVIENPNPHITNNLLINRSFWASKMEKLWQRGDYQTLVGTKLAFEKLLAQHKIAQEISDWANHLLVQHNKLPKPDHLDFSIAWLNIASSACMAKATMARTIELGATIWEKWLEEKDTESDPHALAFLHKVISFLDIYYSIAKAWERKINIHQIASEKYKSAQAWMPLIGSWLALAESYTQLKQPEMALQHEEYVLNDIPYESAPSGFKMQKMIEIIFHRIRRKDIENARRLFTELKSSNENVHKDLFEWIECDLLEKEGKLDAILPIYCRKWHKFAQANSTKEITMLKNKMLEIADALGHDVFTRIFERETPEGTPNPITRH